MSRALRQTPPRSPQMHGGCLEKEEHGLRSHADLGLNPFLAMWPQAGHLIILSPSWLSENLGAGISWQGLQDHASYAESTSALVHQQLASRDSHCEPVRKSPDSLPGKWALDPAGPAVRLLRTGTAQHGSFPCLRTSIQAPAGAGSPPQGDQLEAGLSSRQLPLISIKAFSPIASWMRHQVGSPTLLYPNQINSSKSGKYS